jgi:hypothetical protein
VKFRRGPAAVTGDETHTRHCLLSNGKAWGVGRSGSQKTLLSHETLLTLRGQRGYGHGMHSPSFLRVGDFFLPDFSLDKGIAGDGSSFKILRVDFFQFLERKWDIFHRCCFTIYR